MKYIKKEKFRNTLHNFRGKFGEKITVKTDTMSNDYVYENNKFMFEVLEEKIEEVVEEKIEEIIPVVEIIVNDVVEDIVEVVEEEFDIIVNEKKTALEELAECSTIKQIHKLAEENDLDLDGRIKNVKKLKDDFKEELENKI